MNSSTDHTGIALNENALDIVDSWLGSSETSSSQPTQPVFEKRAQRLGLGAKFVPHKKQEEVASVLKKKLMREKRRKRERQLEERDVSSNSDSEEESLSKAKAIKSKVVHQVKNMKQSQKLQNKKHK